MSEVAESYGTFFKFEAVSFKNTQTFSMPNDKFETKYLHQTFTNCI